MVRDVGARMKRARIAAKMSVEEVATAIGVNRNAVYLYENNKRRPPDDVKEKLAKMYGTTVGWLFFAERPNKTL